MPKRYNEYESWNVVDAKKRTTKEKLLDESNPFRNDPPTAPDPKGPGGPRKEYKEGEKVKKPRKRQIPTAQFDEYGKPRMMEDIPGTIAYSEKLKRIKSGIKGPMKKRGKGYGRQKAKGYKLKK